MKRILLKPILATGIYAAFMVAHSWSRLRLPGGVVPIVIASVIYVSLMSVFLRRQSA
jgi:hypothetical protein